MLMQISISILLTYFQAPTNEALVIVSVVNRIVNEYIEYVRIFFCLKCFEVQLSKFVVVIVQLRRFYCLILLFQYLHDFIIFLVIGNALRGNKYLVFMQFQGIIISLYLFIYFSEKLTASITKIQIKI